MPKNKDDYTWEAKKREAAANDCRDIRRRERLLKREPKLLDKLMENDND